MGVVGFGFAQLCYGMTHFITLISQQKSVFDDSRLIDFLPSRQKSEIATFANEVDNKDTSSFSLGGIVNELFGYRVASDAVLMTGTSVLKHALTEADKIALSLTASHYDQGIYAVTHNYGSLVVRLFFQPLEETCRIAFSRLAAAASNGSASAESEVDQAKREMSSMLTSTLRVVLLFGLLFPLFGPAYARLAVKVALGAKWYSEDTVNAFSAFCFYIFVMGLNGVTEAFMQAAAESGLWSPVNISLVLSSGCFLLAAPSLIAVYGTTGIILANSLSMVTRIISSVVFIIWYLDNPSAKHVIQKEKYSHELTSIVPTGLDVLCMAAVVVCTTISSHYFAASAMRLKDILLHVGVGGVCFVGLVGITWVLHRQQFKEIIETLKASKNSTQQIDQKKNE